MSDTLKMYRCTRPAVYGPGCPGYSNPSARQGYYVRAASPAAAAEELQKKFPGETIQVQEWEE